MTTVDLTVLVTGYEGFVPVTSGVVTVEYVAGARPAVAVDGDQVRFSTPLRWAIEGVPLSIELEPTGATSCAKITVDDLTHRRQLVRWVEIPATGTVAFGDLVDVDRASFAPTDPTPTLLDTIDRQVEAYMAEHPVDASVGVVPLSVSGPVTVPVVNGWTYELTATDAAAVTLDGTPGTQAAIVWSGAAGTLEGQPVADGDVWVAVRLTGGWRLFPVTGGAEPVEDIVPGVLSASAVTSGGFSLTVTGASGSLDAQPFRFSTDNGASWSSWQASPTLVVSGMDPQTTYQCRHQVRDTGSGVADGAVVSVTTSAAVEPMSVTFQDSYVNPSGAASYTWAGAGLGVASASRRVIVGVSWRGTSGAAGTPTVTVAGVTAARIGTNGTPDGGLLSGHRFYAAAVPDGATGDVVVTFGAAIIRIGVALWTASKAPSFVQEHRIDSLTAMPSTLTTAATADQAILGMSVILGDPQTATPAVPDAEDYFTTQGAAGYKLTAWHQNGSPLSETLTSSAATGQALQVTLS